MIRDKLLNKKFPRAYDGFQPSGRMHIAQDLLLAVNVNKMVDAGWIFIFWVADYFAMLNGKFGGDLQKIRTVGKYFVQVWKAAGMKLQNVKFIWASQEINKRSNEYWMKVMDIACQNSIARIKNVQQLWVKSNQTNSKFHNYSILVCNVLISSFLMLIFASWVQTKEKSICLLSITAKMRRRNQLQFLME